MQTLFDIDDDDLKILGLFQDDPEITHVEIAKRVNKSQPAVGARVTKLHRKHLLCTQKGTNFKSEDIKEKLFMVFVDMATKDPAKLIEEDLKKCPFVINAFKRSGARNMTVVLTSTRMEKLESIIDNHFRSNPDVTNVESAFIVDMAKDLILPVDWEFLKYEELACTEVNCKIVRNMIATSRSQVA